MTTANKQLFKVLPQELENYIYEFVSDYRELMKPVITSIAERPIHTCMGCFRSINNKKYREIDFSFCSVSCYMDIANIYGNMYYRPYIDELV